MAAMIFPFADLLNSAPVTPELTAASGEEAIRHLAGSLAGNPAITDGVQFEAELLAREKISSTAMGHGVAFPHARTHAVRQIVMAIGRSRAGVPFAGADGPVHFFFVIGTPPNQVTQYLAVVGRLARLLKLEAVRDQLLRATTAAALRAALDEG